MIRILIVVADHDSGALPKTAIRTARNFSSSSSGFSSSSDGNSFRLSRHTFTAYNSKSVPFASSHASNRSTASLSAPASASTDAASAHTSRRNDSTVPGSCFVVFVLITSMGLD
jgi:hypothetical protein